MSIHYGRDGTGDILLPENIDSFCQHVQQQIRGVDLVVADGGFQDARNQLNQQQLMHQLLLCEILIMLRVLKSGGAFVCKMFETTDRFTLAMLFALQLLFERISIVKPVVRKIEKVYLIRFRQVVLRAPSDISWLREKSFTQRPWTRHWLL